MNNKTEMKHCVRCCKRNTAAVLCDGCIAEMRNGYVGKTFFKKTIIGNRHHGEWVSYQREPMTSGELVEVVIDVKVKLAMQRKKADARAVPEHFEEDTYSNAYDDDDADDGGIWT